MAIFKVNAAEAGQRADVFIAGRYPEFTRSSLEKLFDKKLISLEGQAVKASEKVKAGQQIRVDEKLLRAVPALIELPIIYEDDDVVVMNKPAGILTHSKGALNTESTVASFLKSKIKDDNLSGNRAGIVHRLDRATSGVIIGAKTAAALKHLQKQFSNRKTKKTYIAIVEGTPKPAEAIVDAPILRNPKKPQTFKVDSAGKPAQTHYKVLEESNGKSELELKPVTGRTHQLRVHLAYIGHPVVGDRIYGREGKHMFLHATSLEITLPGSERKVFEAPLPDYFNELKAK